MPNYFFHLFLRYNDLLESHVSVFWELLFRFLTVNSFHQSQLNGFTMPFNCACIRCVAYHLIRLLLPSYTRLVVIGFEVSCSVTFQRVITIVSTNHKIEIKKFKGLVENSIDK